MAKIDMEQIKADREAGTQGPWHVVEDWHGEDVQGYNINNPCVEIVGCEGLLGCKGIDARRIARVPDYEDVLIEAMDIVRHCISCMESDWVALEAEYGFGTSDVGDDEDINKAKAFLERFK